MKKKPEEVSYEQKSKFKLCLFYYFFLLKFHFVFDLKKTYFC